MFWEMKSNGGKTCLVLYSAAEFSAANPYLIIKWGLLGVVSAAPLTLAAPCKPTLRVSEIPEVISPLIIK